MFTGHSDFDKEVQHVAEDIVEDIISFITVPFFVIKNRKLRDIKLHTTRFFKFRYQRLKYGFDESELWSLDYTINKFVLPRLKAFRERPGGYPSDLTPESWAATIDKMIAAFEIGCSDDYWLMNEEQHAIWTEGMDLFREYYPHLWN